MLQVVAMPPVKPIRPQGRGTTRQSRQRSPAGGHEAVAELEKIQELPQKDPTPRPSRSHGPKNDDAGARPRLQTSQNDWRSPTAAGKHQMAFGSPRRTNYATKAARPKESSPMNFSLLIDARKSSLMGET